MSKAKRWMFTCFNVASPPVFDAAIHSYLVFGKETCPTSRRRHLQGFVVFKNRRTLAQVKAWRPGAHFEVARRTPYWCAEYCKKEGDFCEFGSLPNDARGAFAEILSMAQKGDIEGIMEGYPAEYLRHKTNILSSIQFRTDTLPNSCGVWICGPPRIGKDWGVRELARGDLFLKSMSKWWDGYRDEGTVLLSDVEPSHCSWLAYFLKIWADAYPFCAEIKGGSMVIRPRAFVVTSNFPPEACFDDVTLRAIEARFNVYDFFHPEPIVRKRMTPRISTVVRDFLATREALFMPNSGEQSSGTSGEDTCQAAAATSEAAAISEAAGTSKAAAAEPRPGPSTAPDW